MTFAIVGFGAASAAQQCHGGEVSEDGLGNHGDFCCKGSTWSAATYRDVKGPTSWRRWREKVLRLALEQILAPSDMGLPTKIHQMAYNAGLNEKAAVSQQMVDQTVAALHNFRALYPPERWYKRKNCRKGQYDDGVCTGGERTLICWRSGDQPSTPDAAGLVSSLAGVPVKAQQLAAIGKWDSPPPPPPSGPGAGILGDPWKSDRAKWTQAQIPPKFIGWALLVKSLITSMPDAMNGYLAGNERVPATEKFFVAEGGVIKPTPWMANFTKVMNRKSIRLQITPGISRRYVAPKPKVTIGPAALQRVVTKPSAPTEEGAVAPQPPRAAPEPGMDPKTLAIGGVVLVGLGFGAFVLLRKK
jgi:hypothetical protein